MDLPLNAVFEAAGIAAWAAVVVLIVQFGKRLVPGIPETGRGVLYVVAAVCLVIVAGAVWDRGTGIANAEDAKNIVLTFIALATAAIGEYEAGSKAIRVATGGTNPSGPDA